MEVQTNTIITMTATKAVLLLYDFACKILKAIEDGEVEEEGQILFMSRDEIVSLVEKQKLGGENG